MLLILQASCISHLAKVQCPPQIVSNGNVVVMETPKGSIAMHQCDTNYSLVGYSISHCQSNGEWSGVQPECKSKCIKECTYLSLVSMFHAIFNLSFKDK